MKTWILAGGVFVAVFVVVFVVLSLKPGSGSPAPEPKAAVSGIDQMPHIDMSFKPHKDTRSDVQREADTQAMQRKALEVASLVMQKRYPSLDIPRIMSQAPSLPGYAYMAEVQAPSGFVRDRYRGMKLGCFAARGKMNVEHAIFAHDAERFMKVIALDDLSGWIDSGCAAAMDRSPATVSPVQSAQIIMSWMPQTLEYARERQQLMRLVQKARR